MKKTLWALLAVITIVGGYWFYSYVQQNHQLRVALARQTAILLSEKHARVVSHEIREAGSSVTVRVVLRADGDTSDIEVVSRAGDPNFQAWVKLSADRRVFFGLGDPEGIQPQQMLGAYLLPVFEPAECRCPA